MFCGKTIKKTLLQGYRKNFNLSQLTHDLEDIYQQNVITIANY